MLAPEEFRDLALAFPGAVEGGHFDVTDYRVRNRIFATFRARDGRAVLKLSPDEQALLLETSPEMFEPIPGAWGLKGWTVVRLGRAGEAVVRNAMTLAWKSVAPKKLAQSFEG